MPYGELSFHSKSQEKLKQRRLLLIGPRGGTWHALRGHIRMSRQCACRKPQGLEHMALFRPVVGVSVFPGQGWISQSKPKRAVRVAAQGTQGDTRGSPDKAGEIIDYQGCWGSHIRN